MSAEMQSRLIDRISSMKRLTAQIDGSRFPQTKERFRQNLDAEYRAVIEMCAVELESIGSAR
jgi:hypothetical protein